MSPPPPSAKRLRRVGLLALAFALLLAGIGIFWRHQHRQHVQQWTQEQAIPTVHVTTPRLGPEHSDLVLPGNVQAWFEAPLFARVSGYLKNWYVDYGARVSQGDLIAEIDAPDLDAQLAAAQAQLKAARSIVRVRQAEEDFAQTTYERWKGSPPGSVAIQEMESKRGDYRSALAGLHAAQASVNVDQGEVDRLTALEGFKRIVAPFDGIVTARETDVGALINAGSGVGGGTGPELFRVADVHQMRVFVQVPQQMSAGIKGGLSAKLFLPQFASRAFAATVATTARAIDPSSRTLLVELHASNPDDLLQPGSYAQVHFRLPTQPNILIIPTSALLFRQDGLEVAVVGPDDKVQLRPVTAGSNLGTDIEILAGLKTSDQIVDTPPDSLTAGDLVQRQMPSTPPAHQRVTSKGASGTHPIVR